ncbi:DUF1533 domain-containing protein [Paenibacillaceae bacterium]|nr:DUF1533 domain-containing protein [Paenibacillaceae bacterium]
MKGFRFDFTMDQVTENNGKLNFILGNVSGPVAPHQIYLDDVTLSETAEEVPNVNNSLANVALNKPATASSGNASLAFDGNAATRWESIFNDSEFIEVDLGHTYTIDHIRLNWETAYGKGYKIDVKTEQGDWTTVFTTAHGSGGVEELRFLPEDARHVRLTGIKRGTDFGYSLYEFAVFAHDDEYIAEPAAAPVLAPAAEDNVINRAIAIRFADNKLWRTSITGVKVNNEALDREQFEVGAGVLTLVPGLFTAAGDYQIHVEAVRFQDAVVTQTIKPLPPTLNLALHGAASSSDSNLPASFAFDGDPGTRWESKWTDDQWIRVDLGEVYDIGRVLLSWEGIAFGKEYTIDTSLDGEVWHTSYTQTNGAGGVENLVFNKQDARYVRMKGVKRGSDYGYSLWTFEVYPHDPSGLKVPPILSTTSASILIGTPIAIAFPLNLDWEDAIQHIFLNGIEIKESVQLSTGLITIPGELVTQAGKNEIIIQAEGYSDAAVSQQVTRPNKALYASVKASSWSDDYVPANAVDGNTTTRWDSAHNDQPQWFMIDLGTAAAFDQVVIDWKGARAADYTIAVSNDDNEDAELKNWTVVSTITNGSGAQDKLEFEEQTARYVRFLGTRRALPYGYSFYEIAVY